MKHLLKALIFTIITLSIPAAAMADSLADLPIKTVNGKKYHYYQVKPQETVYSICRRFGISRDELYRHNSSAEDMLRADQTLLFPVENTTSTVSTHKVQKGETPYGISKKYAITVDEFFALNPDARDGIKPGDVVYVSRSAATAKREIQPAAPEKPKPAVGQADTYNTTTGTKTHTIAPGETLYQIARHNGVSLTEILAANPDLDTEHYEAGMEIVIPQKGEIKTPKRIDVAENPVKSTTPSNNTNPIATTGASESIATITETAITPVKQNDTITIAIALPFDAANEQRDQRAKRAQEFFRGFVMAVDTMRSYGKPVKVMAFDTKSSPDAVASILANPDLKKANVIIAPDEAAQMSQFAHFAANNNIYLLNLFVVKDEQYRSNPYIMHSNISHDMMYRKAVDYFTTTFPDVTPVILKRIGGKEDKKEFVAELKKRLTEKGRKYHEIEYNDKLSETTLEGLAENGNYAFIPMSSTMDEMHKFIDAVCKYKESHTGGTVSLWGYSEWLTARGENEQRLHDANTFLFSRFYSVENDYEEQQLQNSFVNWYGTRIEDKVPKQGTYGFDTGMYLIRAMNVNGGDFSRNTPQYDGIQNAFHFIPVEGGGRVNDEMFIINFAPAGMTYKFGI